MKNEKVTLKFRIVALLVVVLVGCYFTVQLYAGDTAQQQKAQTEHQGTTTHHTDDDKHHSDSNTHDEGNTSHESHTPTHSTDNDQAGHEEHEGGEHGGMEPLLFVIVALIIGAATRHFLRKFPLPYTVLLLLFGIVLGGMERFEIFESAFHSLGLAITWAGNIDPHLILYVFLPTLVFEAAFAMDVHIFKKSLTNASIMAIPGIIVAMLLSAVLVMGMKASGIGVSKWDWAIALMFGAVISATDPVAVVSLLKELGASKKLGTLIEGESLLNDGTAIVIFMVIFLPLQGIPSEHHPVIEFFRVAVGGVLVGVAVGAVVIGWVRRVFNDALIEICVIVAAAYLTFFIAEGFLHVSGVLGLVAYGLAMAGIGRTRISPEVEHFLHEFWELAAFIANTLIFIIVGVVIAYQTRFSAIDVAILLIIYIGIHIVRAIVIAMFFPFMRKAGYGLPKKDAYVLWWGALRGAIGLALALVVAGLPDSALDPEIKEQFLFYTAGIVLLTLLVNATTIKNLIAMLGLNKIPPAKALMIYNANRYLRQSSENHIDRIKTDRFMNRADWTSVAEYLPDFTRDEKMDTLKIDTITEMRRRVLEKEKSSYWHQFKDGLIGPVAVQQLTEGIAEILDTGGQLSLSDRADLEESWNAPGIINKLHHLPLLNKLAERLFFDKLRISYDSARGFVEAQEEALKLVESMYRGLESGDEEGERNLAIIEEEINENRIHGLTFLRNIRKSYPEIYNAIATRQAARSMLNYEMRTVERLQKNGRVDSGEAHKIISKIEERMKLLMDAPPTTKIPETRDILKDIPWLQELDKQTIDSIEGLFHNRVFAAGDDLTKENKPGDSLYIIARGTVKVTIGDEIVSVLGHGSIIGEMSVLNGKPCTATVTAESPVTALRLKYLKIQRLLQESSVIERNIWEIAGIRFAENLLNKQEPYALMRKKQFKKWLAHGETRLVTNEELKELRRKTWILLTGSATLDSNKEIKTSVEAPAIIKESRNITLSNGEAHIFVCADIDE